MKVVYDLLCHLLHANNQYYAQLLFIILLTI